MSRDVIAALAYALVASAFVRPWMATAHAQTCLPACAGQTLTAPNFSHANLVNADFTGATIIGATFIRANLTGAKFNGAMFRSVAGAPTQTPDFTFATLTNASFVGAQFEASTYFNYATLTCADFSQTNINNNNAIFGDEPLIYDAGAGCRTKFQGTTMNCEFIDDWHNFDLTNAIVSACFSRLAGRNFSNALMGGVSFVGAVLDGVNFAGANLSLAVLDNTSLQCLAPSGGGTQCVDMTGAQLQGAMLNQANLTGASLYKAFLSNNVNGNITQAAHAKQAHLKNVNLSFAELSGVDFTLANFYGNVPANPGGCATTGSNNAGFTMGCSSALHANLTGTKFGNAYLYGLDFTNASIVGVDFGQAVLTGANFAGASIGTNPNSGAVTSFNRAYLQGTNLDKATLAQADLTNAFVDFRSGGNLISIDLEGANHNQFACGAPSTCNPASGSDVCVFVRYPETSVPVGNTTITCPDGLPAGAGGCGLADPGGGNARWNSKLAIGAPPDPGPPPGWYSNDSTYTPRTTGNAVCNGGTRTLNW